MPFVSYSEFTRDLERQKVGTKRELRLLEAEERRLLKHPSLLKVVFSPFNLACWMLLFATVSPRNFIFALLLCFHNRRLYKLENTLSKFCVALKNIFFTIYCESVTLRNIHY